MFRLGLLEINKTKKKIEKTKFSPDRTLCWPLCQPVPGESLYSLALARTACRPYASTVSQQTSHGFSDGEQRTGRDNEDEKIIDASSISGLHDVAAGESLKFDEEGTVGIVKILKMKIGQF